MYRKGDMVEVNARTGGPTSPRAWKRGKVTGVRRSVSAGQQYQIDFMTGKALLWFNAAHVRAIPGVTPVHAVPSTGAPSQRITRTYSPPKAIPDFPHICPNCKAPAYIPPTPGGRVDCQKKCSDDPYIKPAKKAKESLY